METMNSIPLVLYKDKKDWFNDKKTKKVNGCTQEFLDYWKLSFTEYQDLLNKFNNVNCFNCYKCSDCDECYKCEYCHNCNTGWCISTCRDCIGCVACNGCTKCYKCNSCMNCFLCEDCTTCKSCWYCVDFDNAESARKNDINNNINEKKFFERLNILLHDLENY